MLVTPQMMEQLARETHQWRRKVTLAEPGETQISWLVCTRCGAAMRLTRVAGPIWCEPCPAAAWGR